MIFVLMRLPVIVSDATYAFWDAPDTWNSDSDTTSDVELAGAELVGAVVVAAAGVVCAIAPVAVARDRSAANAVPFDTVMGVFGFLLGRRSLIAENSQGGTREANAESGERNNKY